MKTTNILLVITIVLMGGALGYLIYSNIELRKELDEYRIQAVQIPPILPTIDSTVTVVNTKIDSLNKINTALNEKQIRYLKNLIKKGQSIKKIDVSTPEGIDSLLNSINSFQ